MAYPPVPRRVRVEFRERMSGWVLRDGYVRDDEGSIVPAVDGGLLDLPTGALDDPTAIEEQLDRIVRSRDADAGQTIQAARALVEPTCKVVLRRPGRWPGDLGDNPIMPALLHAAFDALGLHPGSVDNERWADEVVDASKRTLGGLMTSVDVVAASKASAATFEEMLDALATFDSDPHSPVAVEPTSWHPATDQTA